MKKEVLVTVSGWHRQKAEEDWDKVEIKTTGTLYEKNNAIYLIYDEVLGDDLSDVSHTRIKIEGSPVNVTITKTGTVASVMTFSELSRERTSYETPYGTFQLVVKTRKLIVENTEEKLELRIVYDLDMDYQHFSESVIGIVATPLR